MRRAAVALAVATSLRLGAHGRLEYSLSDGPAQPFHDLACDSFTFTGDCSCDTVINGAVVEIKSGHESLYDYLWCEACAEGALGIHPRYDWQRGRLWLAGRQRTVREFTEAIASVRLGLGAMGDPVAKVVAYNFGHAAYRPKTGHYYGVVSSGIMCTAPGACRWDSAQARCADAKQDILGLRGYLATLVDYADSTFVARLSDAVADGLASAWVGCSSYGHGTDLGPFYWKTGPEGCPADYKPDATGAERTACDLGYPIADPNSICPAACQSSGTAIDPRSPLWKANGQTGKFCRLFVNPTNRLASIESVGIEIIDAKLTETVVCEWGGVGNTCLADADFRREVEITPGQVDECTARKDRFDASIDNVALWPTFLGYRLPIPSCDDVTFTDPTCSCDSDVISAWVLVDEGYMPGEDELECRDCDMLGVAALVSESYDRHGFGVLRMVIAPLSPPLSLSLAYRALKSVRFRSNGVFPHARRRITWNVGAGWYSSDVGAYFRESATEAQWLAAQARCSDTKEDFLGLSGYLAALSSRAKHDIVAQWLMQGSAWIGATDTSSDTSDSVWRWVTGPEGCPPYDLSARGFARTACSLTPIDITKLAGCGGVDCATTKGTLIGTGNSMVSPFVSTAFNAFSGATTQEPDDFAFGRAFGTAVYPESGTESAAGEDFAAIVRDYRMPAGEQDFVWYDFAADNTEAVKGYVCQWTSGQGVGELCVGSEFVRGTHVLINMDITCDERCINTPCPAGQTCVDPNATHDAANDWVCRCNAPYNGNATAAPAACELNECEYHPLCTTCIDQWGCDVYQLCNDPDFTSTRDWQCTCAFPALGAPTVTSNTSCFLDECQTACMTCLPSSGCGAGQDCLEGSTDAVVLLDWICRCRYPAVGAAGGGPATCILDECDAVGCAINQTCVDGGLAVKDTGDFTCTCIPPLKGSAVGADAICTLDECEGGVCGAMQTCTEGSTAVNALGDYTCGCAPPAFGTAVGGSATCILDECTPDTLCPTCITTAGCGATQTCDDRNTSATSLSDWLCRCQPPAQGAPKPLAPATCTLNECDVPPAATACGDYQLCTDDDTAPAATPTWSCVCTAPFAGRGAQAPAACIIDECAATCAACAPVGGTVCPADQRCIDPDTAAGSLKDWACHCIAPATGAPVQLAPARCIAAMDECGDHGDVCRAMNQECRDADTSLLDTWECVCIPPAEGSPQRLAPAACTAASPVDDNECAVHSGVCAAVQQACVDPDRSVAGNWECRCVDPSKGTAAVGRPAVCILDECVIHGATCDVDGFETCVDPDPRVVGDWLCKCIAPAEAVVYANDSLGAQIPAPRCGVDECKLVADACTSGAGVQVCIDATHTSRGDWGCACVPPYVEVPMPSGPLVCEIPHVVEDVKVLEGGATLAVSASVMSSAGGAGPAMRMLVVLDDCFEGRAASAYPVVMHPTQVVFRGSIAAGAVLGNMGIVVGATFLAAAASCLAAACGARLLPSVFSNADAMGVIGFPSLPVAVFSVLYQGMTLGAAELVMQAPSPTLLAVGIAGVALAAAVPTALAWRVSTAVPQSGYYLVDSRTSQSAFYSFLIGPGEWVSRRRRFHWAKRWGAAMRVYRESCAWFLCMELCAAFALSAIRGARPSTTTGCGHVKVFTSFVFICLCAVNLWVRPFCVPRNNYLVAMADACQVMAMASMAIGYYLGDREHMVWTLSSWLFVATTVIIAFKAICDVLAILIVTFTARRSRLQNLAWEIDDHEQNAACVECDEKLLGEKCSDGGESGAEETGSTTDEEEGRPGTKAVGDGPRSLAGGYHAGNGADGSASPLTTVGTMSFLAGGSARRVLPSASTGAASLGPPECGSDMGAPAMPEISFVQVDSRGLEPRTPEVVEPPANIRAYPCGSPRLMISTDVEEAATPETPLEADPQADVDAVHVVTPRRRRLLTSTPRAGTPQRGFRSAGSGWFHDAILTPGGSAHAAHAGAGAGECNGSFFGGLPAPLNGGERDQDRDLPHLRHSARALTTLHSPRGKGSTLVSLTPPRLAAGVPGGSAASISFDAAPRAVGVDAHASGNSPQSIASPHLAPPSMQQLKCPGGRRPTTPCGGGPPHLTLRSPLARAADATGESPVLSPMAAAGGFGSESTLRSPAALTASRARAEMLLREAATATATSLATPRTVKAKSMLKLQTPLTRGKSVNGTRSPLDPPHTPASECPRSNAVTALLAAAAASPRARGGSTKSAKGPPLCGAGITESFVGTSSPRDPLHETRDPACVGRESPGSDPERGLPRGLSQCRRPDGTGGVAALLAAASWPPKQRRAADGGAVSASASAPLLLAARRKVPAPGVTL